MKLKFIIFITTVFTSITFGQSYQDTIFTNYFKMEEEGLNGGDGTISIALPDGRTLWMFGDSHLDQGVDDNNELPCLFTSRNSVMLQDTDNSFTVLYDTLGTDIYTRQYIKGIDEVDIFYWPSGGFVHGDIAYLFWNKFEKIEDTIFGNFLGMVIVEINISSLELMNITPLGQTTFAFGMAVVTNEMQGYHYIYGRMKVEGESRKPILSRCPIGEIYGNWEYYIGNGMWSNQEEEIVSIADFVSEEYSVFQCGGTYYLLTQGLNLLTCGVGREIYLSESSNPEGPFTNFEVVYTIEDQYEEEYLFTYNAQAHPQFIQDNNLLISYNVNKTCPHVCDDPDLYLISRFDADMYRPKFIRVPLSMCDITETKNNVDDLSFKIYPNPINDYLMVDLENHRGEALNFELYTMQGKLLKRGVLENKIKMLDLNRGLYLLKMLKEGYEQVEIINKW